MRRAAVIGFVAIALVLAALGLRWRAQYQPLSVEMEAVTFGDHLTGLEHPGGALLATTSRSGDFADVADDEDDSRPHVRTSYVDGQHLTYAVALHNRGRVGVTITGFDVLGPEQDGLLAFTDIRVGKRLASGTSAVHIGTFSSFTLRAGETRDVVFHARMHACEHNSPGVTYSEEAVSLHYRVLGLTRHALVPTPMRIDVALPDAATCPRPPA